MSRSSGWPAIAPGDRVLVHGATGGVGLAAVDLAIALGARVVATSRSPEKLAVIANTYQVEATLPATGFRDEVKARFDGGADIVFDPVGGDIFDESTRCIAFGGRLLVVGFTSGRIATVATNIPLIKGFCRHRRSRGRIWPAIPGRAAARISMRSGRSPPNAGSRRGSMPAIPCPSGAAPSRRWRPANKSASWS